MSTLKQRIQDRSVTLGVVGLGYVGLRWRWKKQRPGFMWLALTSKKKRWIWSTADIIISAML